MIGFIHSFLNLLVPVNLGAVWINIGEEIKKKKNETNFLHKLKLAYA